MRIRSFLLFILAGLWLMRAAPAAAQLGIAASMQHSHQVAATGDCSPGTEIGITLVGAATPLIGASVMLAVGTWLRRGPRPTTDR